MGGFASSAGKAAVDAEYGRREATLRRAPPGIRTISTDYVIGIIGIHWQIRSLSPAT